MPINVYCTWTCHVCLYNSQGQIMGAQVFRSRCLIGLKFPLSFFYKKWDRNFREIRESSTSSCHYLKSYIWYYEVFFKKKTICFKLARNKHYLNRRQIKDATCIAWTFFSFLLIPFAFTCWLKRRFFFFLNVRKQISFILWLIIKKFFFLGYKRNFKTFYFLQKRDKTLKLKSKKKFSHIKFINT